MLLMRDIMEKYGLFMARGAAIGESNTALSEAEKDLNIGKMGLYLEKHSF